MLPKKERLNTTDFSEIKNLKFKRLNVSYGFFVIYESGSKKGIVMSKKNFKTAVSRNKIKRLFYNTVREIPSLKAMSFVFHPKKIFTKLELQKDLLSMI